MKNPFSKKKPTVSNEPATAKPKRFSRKQQLIATGVIVALLISGIAYAALYQGRDEAIAADRITDLTPSHFSTTVSATGEVLADKDVDIYTTQTAPIEEIFVEEGEKVEQGQVLAKLDDKKLRQQIRQREAAAGVSARSAAAQIKAARNRYNAAARALQNGTNGAIVSAGSALASAKYAWEAAEKTYRDMKRSIDEGYNPELTNEASGKISNKQAVDNAKQRLQQAKAQLTEARNKYNEAVNDTARYDKERQRLRTERDRAQTSLSQQQREISGYTVTQRVQDGTNDEGTPIYRDQEVPAQLPAGDSRYSALDTMNEELSRTQSALSDAESKYAAADANKSTWEQQITSREDAVAQAQLAYDQAIENDAQQADLRHKSAKVRADNLSTARLQADTAKSAYEQAKKSLAAAQAAANDEIQTFEDNIATTAAAGDDTATRVELASLYEDLQDMTIRAPMAGTISKIYAKAGSLPSGPLFKVENLNSLVIKSELKEFDLRTVRVGQSVKIKADATGDKTYHGRVVSIANTATQSAASAIPSADGAAPSVGSDTNPTFTAKIVIENPPQELLAGMKTRLSIVTAEDQGVYAVPFGAIMETGDKKSVMALIPVKGKKGVYEAKKITVKTELENDINVVISSKELKDHLKILNDPEGIEDGARVSISDKLHSDKPDDDSEVTGSSAA
ncbi:MAG: efflux RND transporter periplasmic adaptor subunit [Clostridiales bacterium]|nr:efflux RND transporter periplasmic adaptor subunit [Clostridiales bacterium]